MAINREMQDDVLILEDTDTGERVEIHETLGDGYVCIAPKGELKEAIAHDLEDELTSIALVCHNLVIDMREVSFIENSVIRMMLGVQHMVDDMEGEFILKGVNSGVLDRFEEMGLDAVFEIQQ